MLAVFLVEYCNFMQNLMTLELRLPTCISYLNHLGKLVKCNGHTNAPPFLVRPAFVQNRPESLIDVTIPPEIAVLACTARTCVRPSCAEADTEQKPEGMPKCSHSMIKY